MKLEKLDIHHDVFTRRVTATFIFHKHEENEAHAFLDTMSAIFRDTSLCLYDIPGPGYDLSFNAYLYSLETHVDFCDTRSVSVEWRPTGEVRSTRRAEAAGIFKFGANVLRLGDGT